MKVKLEIKTPEGKIIETVEDINILSNNNPLFFVLEVEDDYKKKYIDKRMLRITPKNKLVLT